MTENPEPALARATTALAALAALAARPGADGNRVRAEHQEP
ncbi:hypothetical protein [Streptomyces sp. CA-253872]